MLTDNGWKMLTFDTEHLLILIALAVLTGSSSSAQVSTATKPAPSLVENARYIATMTFDVASVRENKDVDLNAGFAMSGRFVPHSTNLRLINWQIGTVISIAYGIGTYQIVGIPQWPWPTLFVIEAKGDSAADARMATLTEKQQLAEQQHMLQVLLEDRFKLKTHWAMKNGDVYNLVADKHGPKLNMAGSMPPSADELKYLGDHPVPTLYQRNDGQGFDFIAHGCSMGEFVQTLAAMFGRPVNDKTSLTGKYDFVLKYKGQWDRERNPDDLDPMPPMDRALQDELGLKVVSAKGLVRTLVIDQIEKPSEN